MRVGTGGSPIHSHLWSLGNKRTSLNDGHTHTVSDSKSGYTDPAGDGHKHKLPKIKITKK